MRFVKTKFRIESGRVAKNTSFLISNTWDDFGYKTTFEVTLFDIHGSRFELGMVRIMRFGMTGGYVELPPEFRELSDDYCSLGSDRKYYIALANVSPDTRRDYLMGIRDCVADQAIWERFRSQDGMRASLLRDASSTDVLRTYPRLLRGDSQLTSFTFSFEFTAEAHDAVQRCEFSVRPGSKPPSNIHVLIGRNGVGKTRLLAGMADALVQNKATSIGLSGDFSFAQEENSSTEFLNLVIVSYSAFDRFDPIPGGRARTDHSIPYYYVGIKAHPSVEGAHPQSSDAPRAAIKSPEDMNAEFRTAIHTIASDPQRLERWTAAIHVMSSDPGIREIDAHQVLSNDPESGCEEIASIFSRMSSGHKIVLLIITKLVEFVSDRSLVLMDEPETHLHPPLLGSFIRALSNLLVSRNGVAIVATHSPVVLQEVPASCVSFLMRSGDSLRVIRPDIETFAENVSVLTRKVFGLEVDQSGFYKLLKDSAEGSDFETVMRQFDERIGGEGRALTRAFTASGA